MDLSGFATIRWRTKISGFHQLHPIVKLADGTWLVGDHATSYSTDWVESEIQLADVRWQPLNIADVVEGRGDKWVDNPNLSKVEDWLHRTDEGRGPRSPRFANRLDRSLRKSVPRAASSTTKQQPVDLNALIGGSSLSSRAQPRDLLSICVRNCAPGLV